MRGIKKLLLERYILLIAFFAACSGCSCNSSRCGMSFQVAEKWRTYSTLVGENIIKVSVPERANGGFDSRSEIGNLRQSEDSTKVIFSTTWEYRDRANYTSPESLSISLAVAYSEESIGDMDALRFAITSKQEAFQKENPLPPDFPNPRTHFTPISFAGRDGWRVLYPLGYPEYVAIVDSHHYLELRVGINVYRPAWRSEAEKTVDDVIRSVRLESIRSN